MTFNHKRMLTALTGFASRIFSFRSLLKIPVFLLILPAGLLLTLMGLVIIICLIIALTPFYFIRYLFWRLSAKGRIHHLQKKYQQRKQNLITFQQRKRIKLSERADKLDIQYLVKLCKIEIDKRKHHVDYIIYIETKRRLHRYQDEMNFDDALQIYSTIVDTELDLLNASLNQLFQ